MNIKKIYYYFFYCFYKFWDYISQPKFWSDTKAVITLIILKSFLFISFLYYFDLNLSKVQLTIIGLSFIIIPDLYLFVIKNEWKKFIIYYDDLPKSKNKTYKSLVVFIVLLILINFFYSRYWMDQRSKDNQTGPYSKEYIKQQKLKDSLDNIKYKKY